MGERKGPWRKANSGGSDSVTFRTALLSKLTPRAGRAAANDAANLIADDVTIAFGGLLAIRNVNLRLVRHEILGLIGPNGAGKTTLVNCFTGFQAAGKYGSGVREPRHGSQSASAGLASRARFKPAGCSAT